MECLLLIVLVMFLLVMFPFNKNLVEKHFRNAVTPDYVSPSSEMPLR